VEPCELYCADADDTVIVPWGDSVMDGTPCNVGTRDMCINGICKVSSCSNTPFSVISQPSGCGCIEIIVLEGSAASTSMQVEEAGLSGTVLPVHETARHNNTENITLMDIAGSTIYKTVQYHNQEDHDPN
jgi:hypothetical protein